MQYLSRSLALILAMAWLSVAVALPVQPNDAAIHEVVTNFSNIWNQPGMPGFADLFTKNADFVVVTGKWLKGREEIVKYHKDLLADFYKGSQLQSTGLTIRYVSPVIAVVHASWSVSYIEDGKQQARTALMTLTFANEEGRWRITAAHNTLTSGPGAMED